MRVDPNFPLSVDGADRSQQDIERVAREFEALLVAEVLQNLSDSVAGGPESDQEGSKLESVLWVELARQLTEQRPLGLADAIYRQLAGDDAGDASPATSALPTDTATGRVSPDDARGLPVAASVSSGFGYRIDPFDTTRRFHHGVDLAAAEGSTVRAPEGGQVVYAGARTGYGNVVILEHPDGIRTLYAHLSRIDVQAGGTLERGAAIGAVGSTGRATGPHLHFEVRRGDVRLDPQAWLKRG